MNIVIGILLPAIGIGLIAGLLPTWRDHWVLNLGLALIAYLVYALNALGGELYLIAVIFGMPVAALSFAWMAARLGQARASASPDRGDDPGDHDDAAGPMNR